VAGMGRRLMPMSDLGARRRIFFGLSVLRRLPLGWAPVDGLTAAVAVARGLQLAYLSVAALLADAL